MAPKLKSIRPKKISDQVFEQLRELIFRGEFKPGQQIMTERELSEALGVSRTSVRDAINKLVALGLLQKRQGQGTFVRKAEGGEHSLMAAVMKSQNATLLDLLEVRMGLECNASALAAQRANREDIAFLESSLDEIEQEIRSGRLGAGADTSFHMAIAYATHNPLQVYMMKHFYDFLFYGIEENLFKIYRQPDQFEIISKQHHAIITAIKSRNPQKAYMATKRHIEFVITHFSRESVGPPPWGLDDDIQRHESPYEQKL